VFRNKLTIQLPSSKTAEIRYRNKRLQ